MTRNALVSRLRDAFKRTYGQTCRALTDREIAALHERNAYSEVLTLDSMKRQADRDRAAADAFQHMMHQSLSVYA